MNIEPIKQLIQSTKNLYSPLSKPRNHHQPTTIHLEVSKESGGKSYYYEIKGWDELDGYKFLEVYPMTDSKFNEAKNYNKNIITNLKNINNLINTNLNKDYLYDLGKQIIPIALKNVAILYPKVFKIIKRLNPVETPDVDTLAVGKNNNNGINLLYNPSFIGEGSITELLNTISKTKNFDYNNIKDKAIETFLNSIGSFYFMHEAFHVLYRHLDDDQKDKNLSHFNNNVIEDSYINQQLEMMYKNNILLKRALNDLNINSNNFSIDSGISDMFSLSLKHCKSHNFEQFCYLEKSTKDGKFVLEQSETDVMEERCIELRDIDNSNPLNINLIAVCNDFRENYNNFKSVVSSIVDMLGEQADIDYDDDTKDLSNSGVDNKQSQNNPNQSQQGSQQGNPNQQGNSNQSQQGNSNQSQQGNDKYNSDSNISDDEYDKIKQDAENTKKALDDLFKDSSKDINDSIDEIADNIEGVGRDSQENQLKKKTGVRQINRKEAKSIANKGSQDIFGTSNTHKINDTDWKIKLRRAISQATDVEVNYNAELPSARIEGQFGRETLHDKLGDLVLAIDESGSMGVKQFKLALSYIDQIQNVLKFTKVGYIFWNHSYEVSRPHKIRGNIYKDIVMHDPKGIGGTDISQAFIPFLNEFKSVKPELLIIFTDGKFYDIDDLIKNRKAYNWYKRNRKKILWVLTPSPKLDFVKTLHVKRNQIVIMKK